MSKYGWRDNSLTAYNITINNNLTIKGSLTFGDASVDNFIIKGRVASMTAAGSAIAIGATYAYGEGIELRYDVSDFTGVGGTFNGMYLRAEETAGADGKNLRGAEIYGVCNDATMGAGTLWGTLTYAYVKGKTAVTVENMYAVQGELTWDASRTHDCTVTTAAACFRAKITGGRVADYTKIHGYTLTIGEMDGDSQTFGYGILMEDDAGMSGTSTLTAGVQIDIGCTAGINIAGACTTAINVSGVQTDETGLTAACLFQHGVYGTPLVYGTQTANLVLKSTCITAAAGSALYVFGDINRITTSAASAGYINVAYDYLSVGHDLVNGWATRGRVDITAGCALGEQSAILGTLDVAAVAVTATGAAVLAAGILDLQVTAAATIAQEVTCLEIRPRIRADIAGVSSGIRININCEQTNYVDYGLDIRSMSAQQTAAIRILATPDTNALACGIHLEGQDSSTSAITNAVSLVGTITNVLDFDENDGSQGAKVVQATMDGDVADALLKIDIAGTPYYVPAFNAAGITGEW